MNDESATAAVDSVCSPDEALREVAAFDGTILVDFDETLWLRNSTEAFIDQAVPGLLIGILLRVLDVLKPWRWTGGEPARDVWRVRMVLLLSPLQWRRWHRHVEQQGAVWLNRPLSTALRGGQRRVVVVSIGFESIIRPLLDAMGWGDVELVACSLRGTHDRRAGKLALIESRLNRQMLAAAMVVTDSTADLPVLERAGRGVLAQWPDARYQPALSRIYLPFDYTSKVKRPGKHYLRRGILLDDYAYWVLATITLTGAPMLHVVGLACLLVSFWSIYERGYVDNDRCGQRFESNPRLSDAFFSHRVATPVVPPWIWAAVLGGTGIALLESRGSWLVVFVAWMMALILLRLLFQVYNRVNYATRVWLYFVLQFARVTACLIVVPVSAPGALALGTLAVSRWIPYYIYRGFGRKWAQPSLMVVRVLLYVGLVAVFLVADPIGPMLAWTTGAVITYGLIRARHELRDVQRAARWIGRENGARS